MRPRWTASREACHDNAAPLPPTQGMGSLLIPQIEGEEDAKCNSSDRFGDVRH